MIYGISFLSGLLFAIGLGLSGMMDPNKVKNFLDLAGQWDASLAFVMGGALLVSGLGFHLAKKMQKPLCRSEFNLPLSKVIDKKLILGSALFGIGWALGGICPGPALANMGGLNINLVIFVASMFSGWLLVTKFELKTK